MALLAPISSLEDHAIIIFHRERFPKSVIDVNILVLQADGVPDSFLLLSLPLLCFSSLSLRS